MHFTMAETDFRRAADAIRAYAQPNKMPPGKCWHGAIAAWGELPHGEIAVRGIAELCVARPSGQSVPACYGTAVPGFRVRCARGEMAYGGTEHARGTTAWARGPAGGMGAAGDSGNSADHGSPDGRARDLLTGCEEACRSRRGLPEDRCRPTGVGPAGRRCSAAGGSAGPGKAPEPAARVTSPPLTALAPFSPTVPPSPPSARRGGGSGPGGHGSGISGYPGPRVGPAGPARLVGIRPARRRC